MCIIGIIIVVEQYIELKQEEICIFHSHTIEIWECRVWNFLHSYFSQSILDGKFKGSSSSVNPIIVFHEFFPSNIIGPPIVPLYLNFSNCFSQMWRFFLWLFRLFESLCSAPDIWYCSEFFKGWSILPP
jgi:hypothetical protein